MHSVFRLFDFVAEPTAEYQAHFVRVFSAKLGNASFATGVPLNCVESSIFPIACDSKKNHMWILIDVFSINEIVRTAIGTKSAKKISNSSSCSEFTLN